MKYGQKFYVRNMTDETALAMVIILFPFVPCNICGFCWFLWHDAVYNYSYQFSVHIRYGEVEKCDSMILKKIVLFAKEKKNLRHKHLENCTASKILACIPRILCTAFIPCFKYSAVQITHIHIFAKKGSQSHSKLCFNTIPVNHYKYR